MPLVAGPVGVAISSACWLSRCRRVAPAPRAARREGPPIRAVGCQDILAYPAESTNSGNASAYVARFTRDADQAHAGWYATHSDYVQNAEDKRHTA